MEESLLRADGNVCRVSFRLPQKAFCLATKSLSECGLLEEAGTCKLRTKRGWDRYCIWLYKRSKPQRIGFQLWVQLEGLRGLCWRAVGVRADAGEEVFRQMLQCASVAANLCFSMMA